jgi:hypothetical protein
MLRLHRRFNRMLERGKPRPKVSPNTQTRPVRNT